MITKRHGLAVVLATGVVAACAALGTAFAQDTTTGAAPTAPDGHEWHHGHGGAWGHGGPWHLYSKLGLTAEQKSSMKAIFAAAKPQMRSLHEEMRTNQQKLAQVTPDDANYSTVVAEVAQTNATLASQRTSQEAQLRAQMYALLTPAQKTQLASLKAEWAAKAAAWKSAHGDPAPAG